MDETKEKETKKQQDDLLEEYNKQTVSTEKHSYSERWHSEDADDGCCC